MSRLLFESEIAEAGRRGSQAEIDGERKPPEAVLLFWRRSERLALKHLT
jgi:hypothetical protein